jgi:D-alanine-D-alanine ligase
MDFIFSDNNFWFLEVNTVPGMTKASIIPKQATIYGLSISELYQKMIDEALLVFQKKENC